MKVLTWNVLHRVHAERFSEPAIEAWPSEARRVEALADRLSTAMTIEGVDVALLQEVSGDLLARVRARLPRHAVLNHVFPRVPRPQSNSLEDCTEHLVVIAPLGARITRAHTFSNDPGKGYVLVALPHGAHVASTHVSWGAKGAEQLATLAAQRRNTSRHVLLLDQRRWAVSGRAARGIQIPRPGGRSGSRAPRSRFARTR